MLLFHTHIILIIKIEFTLNVGRLEEE